MIACRKRRIKCGEERPTCSNCVKSKRNCEGYTPRVIFKDPLGAYRPSVGITQSNGAHFHSATGQTGSNGSTTRVQHGSTSQTALPPIAPRPSPPIQQSGIGASPVVPQTSSAEQYGLFGYTFDGQTYGQAFPETGAPSSVLSKSERQRSSLDDNNILPGPREYAPTPIDQLPRRSLDSLPRALFPPQIDVKYPEQWSSTDQEIYSKWQWSQPPNTEHQPFVAANYPKHLQDVSPTNYYTFSVPQQASTSKFWFLKWL